MRGLVLLSLFALAACAGGGLFSFGGASSQVEGWRMPTGKSPSRVEFAAVVAACQDKTHSSGDSAAVEACLTGDYGLRRVR